MNYFPVHRFKILSILFWKWPCESRPSNNSKELLVITNFSPWWEGKVRKKCWKPTRHHHTQFLPPPAVILYWLLLGFDEQIEVLWRGRLNTLGVLVGVDFNVRGQWKVSMEVWSRCAKSMKSINGWKCTGHKEGKTDNIIWPPLNSLKN